MKSLHQCLSSKTFRFVAFPISFVILLHAVSLYIGRGYTTSDESSNDWFTYIGHGLREYWLRVLSYIAYEHALLSLLILVSVFVGILGLWWSLHPTSIQGIYDCLTARDLPASSKGLEGTSGFLALATFALAEGGALTVVARGEGQTIIVLIIYTVAVIFTLFWIVATLRTTVTEGGAEVRAYDGPSTQYGRFALHWTVFLALIMTFLAWNRLLPNQTHRNAYKNPDIKITPMLLQSRISDVLSFLGMPDSRPDAATWIQWLSTYENRTIQAASDCSSDVSDRFLWIEASSRFDDFYTTFPVRLKYDDKQIVIQDRVAFLINKESRTDCPIYRQMFFRKTGDDPQDIVDIKDPNPGDVLVILLQVAPTKDKNLNEDVEQLGFSLTKDK